MSLAAGDSIVAASSITIVAQSGITLAGNNTIGSSTIAVNLQTEWGDIVASNNGNKTTTFYGNLTSSSGDINLTNALVYGYIDTLDHAVLSGGSVTGNVSGRNGVTTTSGTLIGGNVTANAGTISLSGGSVTGSVHSDCCTITATNTNIGGNLSTTVISSNSNTVTIIGGTVSGTISTSGGSGIVIKDATVSSGSITATGVAIEISNSTIGSSSSQVNVTGNNKVTISGSTVWGNVTAGNWSSALSIDSASIIYGICASNNNSVTAPTQYPRCAGGSGTKVARFNACHNYSSSGGCQASSARLLTRQAGTAFTTDIVALKSDGSVDTSFTGKATISVIARTSTGAALDSQNCFAAEATQTIDNAASAFVAGHLTLSATVPTAYQDVRFKIVCDAKNCASPGVTACSSDDFAIRPSRFSSIAATANADATGASTTAKPVVKVGAGFTLTATAGAGYNGTPQVRNNGQDSASGSYVQAHSGAVTAGVVTASFGTADASTGQATASGASYSEVGYFRFGVDGVYDEKFTSVDRAKSDCTDDYVNSSVNGKIGCYFGNTAATVFFGRFIPDHFSLASSEVASCGSSSTTGTIAASSASLAVADAGRFSVGDTIAIKGAATGGYDLVTTISSKTANVLLLAKTAGVSVSGAPVTRSGFIYMGQPFTRFSARVEARNSLENVTVNYTGRFAAAEPVWVAENNDGGVDLNSGASGRLSGMPSGSWAAGSLDLSSSTASFTRLSTPDGAYDSLFLGLKLGSTEGVPLSRVGMNPVTTGDCTLASSCTAWMLGVSPVKVRFGRLRLDNAYGSERLYLKVPLWAEYWNGQEFVINEQDSCTSIASSRLGLGTYNAPLSSTNFGLDRLPAGPLTLAKGAGSVILSPGNVSGSVFLGVNLSATTADATCSGPLSLGAAATSPDLSFLRGNWCGTGYGADSRAKLTFGVYRTLRKLIHRREVF